MGKRSKEGLGRALIKDRFAKNRHKKHVEDNSMLHTTEVNDGYEWGRLNLQSVTAESSLQEFLSTAELAEKEFAAEKLNIKYVKSAPTEVAVTATQPDFDEPLTVPRRPTWTERISTEEQLIRERDSFLEWRRHLNDLQDKLGDAVTPYERNIELWRQLWRTLEKSDVVLLLLDARNPLLFRCNDLEKYAAEQQCEIVLLLNKADLVNEEIRKSWADYFNKEGTRIIFFSAVKQTKSKQDDDSEILAEEVNENQPSSSEDEDDKTETPSLEEKELDLVRFEEKIDELDSQVSNTEEKIMEILNKFNKLVEDYKCGKNIQLKPTKHVTFHESSEINQENCEISQESNETNQENSEKIQEHSEKSSNFVNTHDLFDREGLLEVLNSYKESCELKNPPRLTIGLIGYPNVGKSSTVNVLMETKKVSVSAMPGHTRHVQSLLLSDDITLLDCPGLVLPARAVAPDLLLTSVLPIHQMRAHDAAIARLCGLVPKHVMERKYGLLLPIHDEEPNKLRYKEVLTSYAYNRGFMTANGSADVSRAARIILAQAAAGELPWAVPPPGYEVPELENRFEDEVVIVNRRQPTPRETRLVEGWNNRSEEIDRQFFSSGAHMAHVKGKPIVGIHSGGIKKPIAQEMSEKPWRLENKHGNKKKREKLRRVYAHLDQH